jgi:adenine-specific DNA-methyltransferase
LIEPAVKSLGFKVLKLAPSNFKQWRGDGIDGAEALAAQVQMFVNGEKTGAGHEDILTELLLKYGQPLTTSVEKLALGNGFVYAIKDRSIIFVLEPFSLELIEPLLALKPHEVIALDSVFNNSDQLKSNLDLQCRDAEVRFICI